VVCYKENNKGYPSLVLEQVENYSQIMPCDVCCSEPLFCRACCCIICGKIVCIDYGGCSYVECQENAGKRMRNHVIPLSQRWQWYYLHNYNHHNL